MEKEKNKREKESDSLGLGKCSKQAWSILVTPLRKETQISVEMEDTKVSILLELNCELKQTAAIQLESNWEWVESRMANRIELRIVSNRESCCESFKAANRKANRESKWWSLLPYRCVSLVNREVFNTIRQYESADPGEHYGLGNSLSLSLSRHL